MKNHADPTRSTRRLLFAPAILYRIAISRIAIYRIAVTRAALCGTALLLAILPAGVAAQQAQAQTQTPVQTASKPASQPDATQQTQPTPPSTAPADSAAPTASVASADPAQQRKDQIAADSAKLFELANELKAEMDKSTKDELSLSVMKKAEEVEKLARKVRDEMRASLVN